MSLHEESIARMKAMRVGDAVTNICAGDKNPHLHCFFLAYTVKAQKNRYGIIHRSHWAKCTDKKGKSWLTDIDVVHPGHLDAETRERLFDPVWQARYGDKSVPIWHAAEGTTP